MCPNDDETMTVATFLSFLLSLLFGALLRLFSNLRNHSFLHLYILFYGIRGAVFLLHRQSLTLLSRKWANSASDGLADPSAIFEAIDTTARCIWSQIPFFSNQGISLVCLYTRAENATASCHT